MVDPRTKLKHTSKYQSSIAGPSRAVAEPSGAEPFGVNQSDAEPSDAEPFDAKLIMMKWSGIQLNDYLKEIIFF